MEVVRGERTAPATIDSLMQTMENLGRMPVHVHQDVPGFLANRLQHALMREAWALIQDGTASAKEIDEAVRYGFGYKYLASGPMMQAEMAGLDVHFHEAQEYYPLLHNNTEPAMFLSDRVARGETGTNTGKGVWDWTPERIAAEQAIFSTTTADALRVAKENDSSLKLGLKQLNKKPALDADVQKKMKLDEKKSDIAKKLEHALMREAWI